MVVETIVDTGASTGALATNWGQAFPSKSYQIKGNESPISLQQHRQTLCFGSSCLFIGHKTHCLPLHNYMYVND